MTKQNNLEMENKILFWIIVFQFLVIAAVSIRYVLLKMQLRDEEYVVRILNGIPAECER